MSETPSNVEVMRQSFEGWNRNDWEASLEEIYDPDVVGIAPKEWPEAGNPEGWEELRAQFARNKDSWEEERVEVDDIKELDTERALSQIRWVTKGKESGIPFETAMTVLSTLRGGRIVRIEFYLDHADALEAAGPQSGA
jgi:ketosteroid isomerase-like protein